MRRRRRVHLFLASVVTGAVALSACGGGSSGGMAAQPRAGVAPAVAGTGPLAVERSTRVRSFDGTQIVTHFFPAEGLRGGGRAPTLLDGPGWSAPGETDGSGGSVGPLRAAGYNVVTWDPRGFGGSGGVADVDYAPFEGRDVSALLSWLAGQPEAQLDATGDPRVGMVGASYGGGIQFVAAANDPRVDVIVPTIAWHSLVDSLYPLGADKAGWGNLLCGLATAGHNRVDAHVAAACASARTGAQPAAADLTWYADHTPASLLRNVHVPTLIFQGTVDTLFPLQQGIENYEGLDGRVPVKMVWFCGGHGECLTNPGPADHTQQLTLAWLARYLKGETGTATGPAFEYVDDTGTWRGGDGYPLAGGGSLAAKGQGTLAVDPRATSGSATAAAPAAARSAFQVTLPGPSAASEIVGAPHLTLSYQGSASPAATVLYAQVVDTGRHLVLGNQASPIPVTLDGKRHTTTLDLAAVAWHVTPSSRLVFQVVGGTALYAAQHSRGRVSLSASLTLPLVKAGTPVPAT